MRRRSLFAVVALPIATSAVAQQLPRLHGADAVFATPDVAIAWAVLKASPSSDEAAIWLRIVGRGGLYSHASIDGVDPFSQRRQRIVGGVTLQPEARVASDRATFSELPSRELHFYRSEADWRADRPALTVYYLGVPDTTPEFSSRAAMDRYLDAAVRLAPPKMP